MARQLDNIINVVFLLCYQNDSKNIFSGIKTKIIMTMFNIKINFFSHNSQNIPKDIL